MGRFKCATVLGTAMIAVAGTAAVPVAHANNFVACNFHTARPFIYAIDGVDYVGGRLDVSDCQTNLPVTQLSFNLIITASGAPVGAMGPGQSNVYTETRDVHNGDSFSVTYPNDDRLVPAYHGVLGTKVTVISGLPGYRDPRFLDYQCSTWPSGGVKCTPAQHV